MMYIAYKFTCDMPDCKETQQEDWLIPEHGAIPRPASPPSWVRVTLSHITLLYCAKHSKEEVIAQL